MITKKFISLKYVALRRQLCLGTSLSKRQKKKRELVAVNTFQYV